MQGEALGWDALEERRHHAAAVVGVRHADRVADRDLVAPEIHQGDRDIHDRLGGDVATVRAPERCGHVAAPPPTLVCSALEHRPERGE